MAEQSQTTSGSGSQMAGRPTDAATESVPPLDIMLLDDHEPSRRMMQLMLQQLGHRVIASGSVKEAINLLKTFVFDLLICDVNLPDGSGLDVLRHLPEGVKAHAIVLSGYDGDDDIRKSLEAGFSAHLVKPVDYCLLQRTVWRIMGQPL